MVFDLQREEGKEEEYDYFLDNNENQHDVADYHIMDADENNKDEEEMLDEEELKQQNANILGEFKQQIREQEEQKDEG